LVGIRHRPGNTAQAVVVGEHPAQFAALHVGRGEIVGGGVKPMWEHDDPPRREL